MESPPSTSTSRPALSRSNSYNSTNSDIDGVDLSRGKKSLNSLTPFGMPLSDFMETFFEPHLDLTARRWSEFSVGVKRSAKIRRDEILQRVRAKAKARNLAGGNTRSKPLDWDGQEEGERDALRKAMEQEVKRLRLKVADRVDKLQERWQDAKVVRLRDKISFVVGIMNLVASSLVFAFNPQWVPTLYAAQSVYYLPLRIYSYHRKEWHYFLFDFCYAQAIINLVYLYILPGSQILFSICFCAAFGPLAFSVATWRNSFVPHSLDKMISLFIHIYPPFVFMTIVHFIPREIAQVQYPALKDLDSLKPWTAFGLNSLSYMIWQLGYYRFLALPNKEKIESGKRINSYSTLSQGKGAIANLIHKVPKNGREPFFMFMQFAYTIITTLPAPLVFFPSARWSSIFLLTILTIAVWNGASYYVEVFGRRFEKELIALKREMEVAQSTEQVARSLDGTNSSAPSSAAVSRKNSQEFSSEGINSEDDENKKQR